MLKTVQGHTVLSRSGQRRACISQKRSRLESQTQNSSKNIRQIIADRIVSKKHLKINININDPQPSKYHQTLRDNLDLQNSTSYIIKINLMMEYGGGNSLDQYIKSKP